MSATVRAALGVVGWTQQRQKLGANHARAEGTGVLLVTTVSYPCVHVCDDADRLVTV